MLLKLQKIRHITNDRIRLSQLIKACCLLAIAMLFISLPVKTAEASGIRIYNYTTRQTTTYTDRQVRVTFNGKQVSNNSTPGILQNGIALVSYRDVFFRGINAETVYDRTRETVTISKYGITIEMTIGSRTARVNGRAVTMPVAPVKIKYIEPDIVNILVPSRFVAENLGLGYQWNSSTNTVAITKETIHLTYDNGRMFEYTGTQGRLTVDGKNVNMNPMPAIIVNNTVMVRAKRAFADSDIKASYNYNSATRTVTLSKNGNTLVMPIGSTVGQLNGRNITLTNPAMIVRNHENNTNYVMVPAGITATSLGLNYEWDRDRRTAIITTNQSLNLSYDNGSMFVYNGTLGQVTIDGESVTVDPMPAIIVNNTVMVRAKRVFADSSFGATYRYNSSNQSVTLTRGGNTLVMTIGSNQARLNGNPITLPNPAMIVRNHGNNTNYVMVPAGITASSLGYGYEWDNNNNVAVFTSRNTLNLSYDNGNMFEYSGTLGQVRIDGVRVTVDPMPAIIVNNTVMVRAKRVFGDSSIGAGYHYNSATRTVTLTKNNNTLVMTIGSSLAHLNGQPLVLSNPAMIVRNHDNNTNYVMVPAGVTTASLGYDYVWDRDQRLVIITSRPQSPNNNQGSGSINSPELGDSGSAIEPGIILHHWKSNDSISNQRTHELNMNVNPGGNPGFITGVTRLNNGNVHGETFVITNTQAFGRVTSRVANNRIIIEATNVISNNETIQTRGINSHLVENIQISSSQNNSTIEFNILPEHVTYDLSLSQDMRQLHVTIHRNSVTEVTIGTNNVGDYITLTGINPLRTNISAQGNILTIDLPFTSNRIGNQSIQVNSKNIKNFHTISLEDRLQLVLQAENYREFFVSEQQNRFTIFFIDNQPPAQNEVIDPSQFQIRIPRPAGIRNDQISHEDLYHNNRFVIRIPGNHTTFFNNNSITNNASVVTNVAISVNNRNETEIRFTTSRLQGYRIAMDSQFIYIRVGNPRDIYKNIVILDPGHGGTDPGAVYGGVKESDLVLTMLYDIGRKYFDSDTSPIKVYYTRTTDVFIPLRDRADFSSKMGADLFVSLHLNAATNTSATGTEVFFSNNNNVPNSAGLRSSMLATLLTNNLSSSLGTINRGAKAANYTVINNNTVPAVLIELGFMSNPTELARLRDPQFQDTAMRVLYETLVQVFVNYPTGR